MQVSEFGYHGDEEIGPDGAESRVEAAEPGVAARAD